MRFGRKLSAADFHIAKDNAYAYGKPVKQARARARAEKVRLQERCLQASEPMLINHPPLASDDIQQFITR